MADYLSEQRTGPKTGRTTFDTIMDAGFRSPIPQQQRMILDAVSGIGDWTVPLYHTRHAEDFEGWHDMMGTIGVAEQTIGGMYGGDITQSWPQIGKAFSPYGRPLSYLDRVPRYSAKALMDISSGKMKPSASAFNRTARAVGDVAPMGALYRMAAPAINSLKQGALRFLSPTANPLLAGASLNPAVAGGLAFLASMKPTTIDPEGESYLSSEDIWSDQDVTLDQYDRGILEPQRQQRAAVNRMQPVSDDLRQASDEAIGEFSPRLAHVAGVNRLSVLDDITRSYSDQMKNPVPEQWKLSSDDTGSKFIPKLKTLRSEIDQSPLDSPIRQMLMQQYEDLEEMAYQRTLELYKQRITPPSVPLD